MLTPPYPNFIHTLKFYTSKEFSFRPVIEQLQVKDAILQRLSLKNERPVK
jgi:hypothetical protein